MTNNTKARVFHFDLHGKREEKYDFLTNQSIESIQWGELEVKAQGYFFIKKDYEIKNRFDIRLSPVELFVNFNSGVQTEFDEIAIQESVKASIEIYKLIKSMSIEELLRKFNLPEKYSQKFQNAKDDLNNNPHKILKLTYRPFEQRSVVYTGHSNGLMGRPRENIMKHMFNGPNICLVLKRARLLGKEKIFNHCFISSSVIDKNFLADQSYCFPLYLFPESKSQTSLNQNVSRTPNLNPEIVQQVAGLLGLTFTGEKEETEGTFAPIDLLDYIYAVLHSPTYRAKYKEFLKIDFPRVPYPNDPETFWQLVKLGGELRQIHLLESPVVEKFITTYPNDGSNQMIKSYFEEDKVWINDQQYFDHVPPVAWNFYIGGYQPAQKWLKDRKGRTLSFDDIMHYQKIIVALSETDRIMKEIDGVEFE